MFSYEENEKIVNKAIRKCICESNAYYDEPYTVEDYFQKHLMYGIRFYEGDRLSDIQGAVKLLGTNGDKTKAQFVLLMCNDDPRANDDYHIYEKLSEFLSDYDEQYKFVANLIQKGEKEFAEGEIEGVGRYHISPSDEL